LEICIRDALDADVPGIEEIGRRTWPATYAFAGEDYVAYGLEKWWSGAAIRRSLGDTTVLVATVEDELVGVANVDMRGDVPIIWKLYVVPEWQGSGVGSALMSGLLDRVSPEVGSVRLEYLDGNDKAARFYATQGFKEVRREPGEQPGWPAIIWVERPI
jgi:GNAT superfamily N-acetyltransferase